uniref:Coiled-coil domain-containing protein n=1 Tax=Globodera pallida TaxID=36090 RepID=A0A183CTL2_GLOPA
MQQIPLGFGSSSSRGFVLSATGRTAPAALEQRQQRNASASAAIRRNSADSATYKAWLRKKQEAGQAKRHREAARDKEEAEKRAEQKKLAEVNFERWRRELDTRMAARKARDKRAAEARAAREKHAKEEQKANAEKAKAPSIFSGG